MDHNCDDACWHEVYPDIGGGLCKCPGYEPEQLQTQEPRREKPIHQGLT
jgi:hypothetical protein